MDMEAVIAGAEPLEGREKLKVALDLFHDHMADGCANPFRADAMHGNVDCFGHRGHGQGQKNPK